MSCGVGCRRGSDPMLLWLWRRPVDTAPIGPLAWEPPNAAGAALEMAKKKKKKKDGKIMWKPNSFAISRYLWENFMRKMLETLKFGTEICIWIGFSNASPFPSGGNTES